MKNVRWKNLLLLALKVALGSSIAIYIAEHLQLEFAASAGIIALLTLSTTRKGTIQLSMILLITVCIVAVTAWATFVPIKSEWVAFGVFIFVMTAISEITGWRATLSVNAVIGTHFLTTRNFSFSFFLNELMLVLIGIAVAFVLNLFQDNRSQKEKIRQNIIYTEEKMQEIFHLIVKVVQIAALIETHLKICRIIIRI